MIKALMSRIAVTGFVLLGDIIGNPGQGLKELPSAS
jgi:hypothetical protein